MGIRTLHRHTAPAQATTDATASTPPPSVPPFAATASTARIPTDLATDLRKRTADLRHRLTRRDWRLTVDQARSYLALLLTALTRSRQVRTVTVFMVTAAAVSDRLDGSAPGQDRAPGPDATP
ncbi:hypothetical protein [Streptomyces sp. WM6386]|uniref:hypothetical protein n=1 Tax=Streptomyces sp. WM6386 TaxID=1415558 RepID=UPI0006191C36|nr:hypothetical protein [Streptomyces sp. WM6386]KKD02742.1 hypothetical protein TN53_38775 [Streptomyces sp. WM6386]